MPVPSRLPTRRLMLGAAGAALAAPWIAARAQPAQSIAGGRPITLVVSYPAGGGADLMARILAPKLGEALGQSVVVDNKPGASAQHQSASHNALHDTHPISHCNASLRAGSSDSSSSVAASAT